MLIIAASQGKEPCFKYADFNDILSRCALLYSDLSGTGIMDNWGFILISANLALGKALMMIFKGKIEHGSTGLS